MKKIIHATLIYTVSFSLLAQDCGSVKDGETVRLDDEGMPLHKARVQDQDGIGSCYANTASIMLQGALPDSPEVSYINLALQNGEKLNKTKSGSFAFSQDQAIDYEATAELVKLEEEKKRANKNYVSPINPLVVYRDFLLLESGNICETINNARDAGGVCDRKDVPLENVIFNAEAENFVDDQRIQQPILSSVSKYYDEVNLAFNSHKLKDSSLPILGQSKAARVGFLSPDIKNEVKQAVDNVGKGLGGVITDLASSFKNFFKSVLGGGTRQEPAPVEYRNVIPLPPVEDRRDQQKLVEDDKRFIKREDYAPFSPVEETADAKPLPQIDSKPVLDNDREEDLTISQPALGASGFSREKFEKLKHLNRPLSAKESYQLALYNLLQKNANEYAPKNCSRLDTTNALLVSNNVAAIIQNQFKSNSHTSVSLELYNNMVKSGTVRKVGKSEIFDFRLNEKFVKLLNDKYLKSFSQVPAPTSGKDAFIKAIRTIMLNDVSEKNIEVILNNLDPSIISLLEEDYKRYVQKDFSKCSEDKLAYLKNNDGLVSDFKTNACLAQYETIGGTIQNLVSNIEKSNIKDFEKIADALLNAPDLGYEKALNLALAPTCTDATKIKIPKNLSCERKNMGLTSFHFRENPPLVPNEKFELENAPKIFRNDMITSIGKSKLPIGLSVCTIFLQETPSYNYHKTKSCNVSRNNGLHAVNLIGYRCKKGKMDYLIQNSWGEWRDLNSSLERDSKFGKAWLSEESIVLNTIEYSVLKKDK